MAGNPVEPQKRLLPPGVPPPSVVFVTGVKRLGDVPTWNGNSWSAEPSSDNVSIGSVVTLSAGVLAGRGAGTGSGPIQEIIVGSGLSLSGNTLSASGGSGTVTSVALTAPAIFSVAGSPITSSGTLAISLATQVANNVWAGPSTGSDAAPTFRSLVAADIPNLDAAKITSGTMATARLGSGSASSATYLRGDSSWQSVPTSTVAVMVLSTDSTNNTTSLSAVPDWNVVLEEDSVYSLEYYVIWQSDTTGSGIALSVLGDGGAVPVIHLVHTEVQGATAAATVDRWSNVWNESGTLTTSLAIDAANANKFARVSATIVTPAGSGSGQYQLRFHGGTGATITIKAGTSVVITRTGDAP